jgi:hypothetical protein
MKKLMSAVIALSLLAGCSTTKISSQVSNPGVQPSTTQVPAPVAQVPVSNQQSITQIASEGWVPIMVRNRPMVDDNNTQYFWHPPTLKRDGNQVAYLSLVISNTLNINEPKFSLGQIAMNCQTGAFKIISSTIYNTSGQVINTISNAQQGIVQPGSVDEVGLMNVCNAPPTITEVELTRIQLEHLDRTRQINAEMIKNAMENAANMFR